MDTFIPLALIKAREDQGIELAWEYARFGAKLLNSIEDELEVGWIGESLTRQVDREPISIQPAQYAAV